MVDGYERYRSHTTAPDQPDSVALPGSPRSISGETRLPRSATPDSHFRVVIAPASRLSLLIRACVSGRRHRPRRPTHDLLTLVLAALLEASKRCIAAAPPGSGSNRSLLRPR